MILKAEPGKTKSESTLQCNYCKMPGYLIRDCEILKAKKAREETSNRSIICFQCSKEGHIARNCSNEASTAKAEGKNEVASAKLLTVEKEEVETISYMAKAEKRKADNP